MAYIFGGDTGKSYEDILREREIANALTERGLQSRNTGLPGAVEQIGTALLARMKDRKVSKKEEGARSDAKEARERLLAALTGGGAGPGGVRTHGPDGVFGNRYGGPEVGRSASGGVDMGNVSSAPLPSAESEGIGDAAMDAIGQPRQRISPEFAAVQSGIFAGESGGDYNALFGFSNRPGGAFEDTKLTEMTVDEALQFASPQGEYAAHVRPQVGRTATPMGAYQVVGTTLRAAKEGLGLTGNEVMTPELQDQIGEWIFQTQGTGAWEGYRGSPSGGGGGGAPAVGGAPSMGGAQGMEYAMAIMDNPYASDADRALAGQFIQRTMQQPEGLTAWQKAQLGLKRQEMEMRASGKWSGPQTVVNTGNVTPEGGKYRQPITPGQEKVDEKFADVYLDWTGGGGADTYKNITQLETIANKLASGENVSGPGIGTVASLPGVGPILAPTATNTKEQVDEVIQRNLRLVLGAQFAAKEGEQLIARAYNPKLDESVNAARLNRLLVAMKAAAEAKQSQVDYFEENGTLVDYRGADPRSVFEQTLGDGLDDGGGGDGSDAPEGIDPEVWSVLTPEQRQLWQN